MRSADAGTIAIDAAADVAPIATNERASSDAGIDAAAASLPSKSHDSWPLTTPCVDVLADATTRAKHAPVMEPQRYDVDHDGELDTILTTAVGKNRRGYVYLARGSCAHFAGEWEGGPNGPIPTDDGTMLNAWEECRGKNELGACCPKVIVRRYVWNGRIYAFRETWIDKIGCFEIVPL